MILYRRRSLQNYLEGKIYIQADKISLFLKNNTSKKRKRKNERENSKKKYNKENKKQLLLRIIKLNEPSCLENVLKCV